MAIKDKVLDFFLTDFLKRKFGSTNIDQTEAFEHFVNYCVVSRIDPDAFELTGIADLRVGGKNDTGLDGIAVFVNDRLIRNVAEIESFKKTARRLDVEFVFIQSKTSPEFDSGEMLKFLKGVYNFFQNPYIGPQNEFVKFSRQVKDQLYEEIMHFERAPICSLFYVTTGKWNESASTMAYVTPDVKALEDTGLFDKVRFLPVDGDKLKSYYKELTGKIETEIVCDKVTPMPIIEGVEQAYIGLIAGKEFLRLITDDQDKLRKTLFYDNVRDFQGDTPVNRDIKITLTEARSKARFSLLNNGVTIVAKSLRVIGQRFVLTDYQIVNGCQTSHILYESRGLIDESVWIPVKLISSSNTEVTNTIIQATNRQTEVKKGAFESLKPFHKKLEDFYLSQAHETPNIYYERRSKQYQDNTDIDELQIIPFSKQVLSVLSMFLEEPHSSYRNYEEILEVKQNELFLENHQYEPYYASALALYSLEKFFRENDLNSVRWANYRFYLILLYKVLCCGTGKENLNSKDIVKTANIVIASLRSRKDSLRLFRQCCEIVETVRKSRGDTNEPGALSREFTVDILKYAVENYSTNANPSIAQPSTKNTGKILKWFPVKGYGFIKPYDEGENIFCHATSLEEEKYRAWGLAQGDQVEYDVEKTAKGFQAKSVIVTRLA